MKGPGLQSLRTFPSQPRPPPPMYMPGHFQQAQLAAEWPHKEKFSLSSWPSRTRTAARRIAPRPRPRSPKPGSTPRSGPGPPEQGFTSPSSLQAVGANVGWAMAAMASQTLPRPSVPGLTKTVLQGASLKRSKLFRGKTFFRNLQAHSDCALRQTRCPDREYK